MNFAYSCLLPLLLHTYVVFIAIGLVGILYKSFGIILPRDASPMFSKSQNVTGGPSDLLPGDLFFYAHKATPGHM